VFHLGADKLRERCGGDLLEVQSDTDLRPIEPVSCGEIVVLMNKRELVAQVKLEGSVRSWRRAHPVLKMEGKRSYHPNLAPGLLSARWPFKPVWGKSVTFSVVLQDPAALDPTPRLPTLPWEVKPKLETFEANLEGEEVRLVGKAHAVPLGALFRITCERRNADGAWTRDEEAEGKLHYVHQTHRHPTCGQDGSFGATIAKSDLEAASKWRFTWQQLRSADPALGGGTLESKTAEWSRGGGSAAAMSTAG
jgi:hypothetical protein